MTVPQAQLAHMIGTYAGEGAWIDVEGDSKPYRVQQVIAWDGEALNVDYTHDFYQENSVTSGSFRFERHGDTLLKVFMKGNPLGMGYVFGEYLHYHLKVGEIFVQASYQATAGGLSVNGSSTSNSQGRYVAWHEALTRNG